MTPIRVGVIGAGKQSSKHHLPILQKLSKSGECALIVVCDINEATAKRAQEAFGFKEYATDARAVCERNDIDAIYVVGTVTMHFDFMMLALSHGKHVFVEKPPAKNTDEMLQAAALAKQAGKVAVAGFNRRFYPSINAIKDLLQGKSDIYSIEGAYNKSFLRGSYAYDSSSWITYSSIHGIDALLYLMGEERPSELYSTWNTVPNAAPENLSALFVWKNGAHGILSSNNTAGSRMENYVVHSLGTSYSCDEERMTVYTEGEEQTKVFGAEDSSGFFAEHLEFFKAIREGIEPRNSIKKCVAVMHVAGLIEAKHHGSIDWSLIDSALGSEASLKSTSVQHTIQKLKEPILKPSILILNPGGMKHALTELSKEATIVYADSLPKMSEADRKKISAVITGIGGGEEVADSILEMLPSIKVVGVVGASVKKYNSESIIKQGIPIISASPVYANAVAEFNLLQAMIGIKNASRSHDVMRRGGWGIAQNSWKQRVLGQYSIKIGAVLPGSVRKVIRLVVPRERSVVATTGSDAGARGGKNLHGLTVGLIGYGAISKKFIMLLKPFECKIKVFSDHLDSAEAEKMGITKVTLADALNADIVSLHRGLSDRTVRSFGSHEFESLKPGAIFINAARGELIDEAALVRRLKKGDIFACLDVFEDEPLPRKSPLRKLPNVFLSSHIAGATRETYGLAGGYIAHTVLEYLRGEEVDGMIDSLDRLKTMS